MSLPAPPIKVSVPNPPSKVSLPAPPSKMLLPVLPVMTLLPALPVPLIAVVPVKVRFSMFVNVENMENVAILQVILD